MRPWFAVLFAGLSCVFAAATPAVAEDVAAAEGASPTTLPAVPLEQRGRTEDATLWIRCRNPGPPPSARPPGAEASAWVERVVRPEWTTVEAQAAGAGGSGQGGGASSLAMQLQNPLAALISVPIQANLDEGFGPDETGYRWTVNVQPVIPVRLSSRWNLISRTVVPVIAREGLLPGEDDLIGLGDFVQTFFFSPNKSKPFVWGVGPVVLLPTATDDKLGADKWGLGPAAIVLKQAGPWTYGLHANHIWSFADAGSRTATLTDPEVNATFLQPFLSYTFPSAFSLGLSSEAIYDWESDAWNVPVILSATQVTALCRQPVSIGLGVRYWAETPRYGPEWGIRLVFTLLFPKK